MVSSKGVNPAPVFGAGVFGASGAGVPPGESVTKLVDGEAVAGDGGFGANGAGVVGEVVVTVERQHLRISTRTASAHLISHARTHARTGKSVAAEAQAEARHIRAWLV